MCFSSIQPWSSTTAPCWNSRITTGMRIISAGLCWRFVCIELWTKERRVLQNTAFLCDTAVISIWNQRLDKGKRSAETTEWQKRLKRWYIFLRILDKILTVWYTEYAVCNVQLIWQLSRSTHRSYPKKGIFYGNLFRTRLSGVRSENKVSAVWKPIEVRLSHDLPL